MLLNKLRVAVVGLALAITHSCSANQQEYPFVEVVTYRANDPIEDRHCFTRLNALDAFTATVFDGHGGDLTVYA